MQKSNKAHLRHTHVISPKRVISGAAHLRGLAFGQHCSEDTLQRRQGVDYAVSDLADRESNHRPFAPIAIS